MPQRLVFKSLVNRSKGSFKLTDGNLQHLNIDANSLGQNGITIEYATDAADVIEMMTHNVPSPRPIQTMRVTIDLSRVAPVRQAYTRQVLIDCVLGGGIYTPMVTEEDKIQIQNCFISNEGTLSDTGTSASSPLVIMGYRTINDNYFGAGA